MPNAIYLPFWQFVFCIIIKNNRPRMKLPVTTFFLTYTNKSLDLEENAHEQRGKQNKAGNKTNINTFLYQNQNFISISRKNIVPLWNIFCCKK